MSLNINIFNIILQIFLIIAILVFLLTTNIKIVINNMSFYNYEFQKYEIADYSDSTIMFYRRFSTDPIEPDSINIRHIIVGLDVPPQQLEFVLLPSR